MADEVTEPYKQYYKTISQREPTPLQIKTQASLEEYVLEKNPIADAQSLQLLHEVVIDIDRLFKNWVYEVSWVCWHGAGPGSLFSFATLSVLICRFGVP
jgi:hypothetical protein